jgi:hypothetical protein
MCGSTPMTYISTETFFHQSLVREINVWLYVNLTTTYNRGTLFQKHNQ